jgi:peptidyl-tRNA hydrolase
MYIQEKMYVVVRDDLTIAQKAVQAGHALAEYLLRKSPDWTNGVLVYLKVDDKDKLYALKNQLLRHGYDCVWFNEPDLCSEITALACLGNNPFFKSLQLLD